MEEWKKVNEYPNFSVSNKGRVRNNLTGNILKPRKDRAGYEYVAYSRVEGKQSLSSKRKKKVKRIEDGKIYNSITEVSKECGVVISSMSLCLTGRYKTAGGYHWKYI